MAASYELKASVRNRVGKGAARALRREGLIPAVIYGDKKAALPISIPLKETTLALHKGGFLTHIATIEVDGEKHQVIAKDFQRHPVRDDLT
ncbi:MAG: 50S ribosomal protein L25, partial [Pannonibacter indicus]